MTCDINTLILSQWKILFLAINQRTLQVKVVFFFTLPFSKRVNNLKRVKFIATSGDANGKRCVERE